MRSLCSESLRLFPLTATAIFGSVVGSTDAALQVLLWGDTHPELVAVASCHAPKSLPGIMLCVSEALSAFSLQSSSQEFVRLHLNKQTPDFSV